MTRFTPEQIVQLFNAGVAMAQDGFRSYDEFFYTIDQLRKGLVLTIPFDEAKNRLVLYSMMITILGMIVPSILEYDAEWKDKTLKLLIQKLGAKEVFI
ncbi:MAG: hypothetical protein QW303_05370 [Nitrososphaerota archaeon]